MTTSCATVSLCKPSVSVQRRFCPNLKYSALLQCSSTSTKFALTRFVSYTIALSCLQFNYAAFTHPSGGYSWDRIGSAPRRPLALSSPYRSGLVELQVGARDARPRLDSCGNDRFLVPPFETRTQVVDDHAC
jgi:hypothetical protein